MDVKVKWTGEWPRKCKGRWIFEVDGKDYRYLLPFANDDGFDLPADTFGEYECWDFDSEGEREWFHYENGLDIDVWCDINRDWLEVITPNEHEWDDIYFAFQAEDWRFNECGGCVYVNPQLKEVHLNTVLDLDDELAPYCVNCTSRETMGIEGVQYKFIFPNGYGASVIKQYGSYGWNMDLWEVALLNEYGDLVYVNDFEWDVVGNLDDKGVNDILHKILNYEEVKNNA